MRTVSVLGECGIVKTDVSDAQKERRAMSEHNKQCNCQVPMSAH